MSGLFVFVFLVSTIAFIISMIKPSLFSKVNISSRKAAALSLGGLAVFFFMLTVITTPNNQQSVAGLATQNIAARITNIPTLKPTAYPTPTVIPTVVPTLTPIPTTIPSTNVQPSSNQSDNIQPSSSQDSTGLSNNNYYTNVDGNQVHSPADSTNGQVPAGATAQCNDGTYSFSQHHSGTCSGHGGVANWL